MSGGKFLQTDLEDAAAGEQRRALDLAFTAAYDELRRLAAAVRRDDPRATLNPTALVNEAWFKLAACPLPVLASRVEFKRIAARAMRQLLIESARRRHAEKRGGDLVFVTFTESLDAPSGSARQLLALDAALETLAEMNARQAAVVECRFFGGLEVAEIAAYLGVSEATVLRDWRAARAWLAAELGSAR
jgi:RNA polymerase sigma factor (TIGR02999 family)